MKPLRIHCLEKVLYKVCYCLGGSPGSSGHVISWIILIGRRKIAVALSQAKNLSWYLIED